MKILLALALLMSTSCTVQTYGSKQTGDFRFSGHLLNQNKERVEFDHVSGDPVYYVRDEDNITGATKLYRTYTTGEAIDSITNGISKIYDSASRKDVDIRGLENKAAEIEGAQKLEELEIGAGGGAE